MLQEAFLAGLWSSIGNTLGKLSGTSEVIGDSYIIWAVILAAMIVVNTWSLRHYMRSLDAASSTVAPTVISSASSYVLCGMVGVFIFKEATSVKWWIGACLIIAGLILISLPRQKRSSVKAE